jgi:hypothetical protein
MQTLPPYVPGQLVTPDQERLLAQLDTTAGPHSCWPFTGPLNGEGYGRFWLDGRPRLAHAAAYILFVTDLPFRAQVQHTCHKSTACRGGARCTHRACANPAHLVAHLRADLDAINAAAALAAKRPPFQPDREEIAWAGGLFEGEGCVTITTSRDPGHQRTFTLALSMTDLDPVERFAAAVGVGKVRGPYGPYKPTEKPIWQWRISRYEQSQAVIVMLWPWLGSRRHARALEVMHLGKIGVLPTVPARQVACKRGHPWTSETTYTNGGKRHCRICLRASWRRKSARQRAARLPARSG